MIFSQKSDKQDDNGEERALSMERFITLCVEHNWFKGFDLQKFLRDNSQDKVNDYPSLLKRWKGNKKDIQTRLFKAEKLTRFYTNSINKIDKTLNKDEVLADPNLQMIILLTYKIVELESRDIYLNYQVQQYLPKELNIFLHYY